MADSILNDTKKLLGLGENYTPFDLDIMTHINTVFSTLTQLGVGPVEGFSITDAEANWDSFLASDKRLNSVKSYMYLKVRLLFDPPATSFAIEAMKSQAEELEWRLNVQTESTDWIDPQPIVISEDLL